jgi:rRNA maturation endonuclease Nob1
MKKGRKTIKAIMTKCHKCKRIIVLGWTGIAVDDKDYCDKCAGVKRNRLGYIKG